MRDVVDRVVTGVKIAGLGVLLVAPFVESVVVNFGRPGVGERPAPKQQARRMPVVGMARQ